MVILMTAVLVLYRHLEKENAAGLSEAMQKARAAFPALEVTASVPFDADGGDSVQWTVLPQFRLGLTKGGHVALAFGVEIPLSDQSWDTRYHMNVLWDFADGSLFMGW